ncbi:hypothetical protein GCM10027059_26720 [Myceligenerans halotolerans]
MTETTPARWRVGRHDFREGDRIDGADLAVVLRAAPVGTIVKDHHDGGHEFQRDADGHWFADGGSWHMTATRLAERGPLTVVRVAPGSLGDRLRDEAHNLGITRLHEWGDEADRMERERDRAVTERDEVLAGLDGGETVPAQIAAQHMREVTVPRLTSERDQARADLMTQERITAELQAVAQVVHTVRTRGGVGELPGVRIERVEDGKTATMRRLEEARQIAKDESATRRGLANRLTEVENHLREAHTSLLTAVEGNAPLVKRAEEAEAVIGRVRGLLERWNKDPLYDTDDMVTEALRALAGGTEADHVHRWQDQTTHADRKRRLVCTVDGCGETREERRP